LGGHPSQKVCEADGIACRPFDDGRSGVHEPSVAPNCACVLMLLQKAGRRDDELICTLTRQRYNSGLRIRRETPEIGSAFPHLRIFQPKQKKYVANIDSYALARGLQNVWQVTVVVNQTPTSKEKWT